MLGGKRTPDPPLKTITTMFLALVGLMVLFLVCFNAMGVESWSNLP